jgi:hypothetical protein
MPYRAARPVLPSTSNDGNRTSGDFSSEMRSGTAASLTLARHLTTRSASRPLLPLRANVKSVADR